MTVHFGDCREVMRNLIADGVKVQTCVTSPPYWGLRDYGVDGQLGLEKTPEEFITNMVEVFSLVKDLLHDDGTLWLNMGDSYSHGGAGARDTERWPKQSSNDHIPSHIKSNTGLKPKDLVGIPWMLAFALRADGWYLRSDIIWSKPNPMPESVRDRPTKSHEYIFLLSKSERYHYDHEAIKEERTSDEDANGFRGGCYVQGDIENDQMGKRQTVGNKKVHTPSGWDTSSGEGGHGAFHKDGRRTDKQRGHARPHEGFNNKWDHMTKEEQAANGRNKRTVWNVATQPYKEAHFATFPTALIEPCILAGSRPGDIVLDPFFGSGTTGEVAQNLGREWIGIELNEGYAPLQKKRTQQMGLAI